MNDKSHNNLTTTAKGRQGIITLAALAAMTVGCDQQPTDPLLKESAKQSSGWLTADRPAPPENLAEASALNLAGVSTNAANDIPIYDLTVHDVCKGVVYRNRYGAELKGKKECGKDPCHKSLQLDCRAVRAFPAVALENIEPTKMTDGYVLAGIRGTYKENGFRNCGKDGDKYCTSNATYPAVDSFYLRPKDFRKDFEIPGVLKGTFPSKDNPLADVSRGTTQLNPSNFLMALRSANKYHYWDAKGDFHIVGGDQDLHHGNLVLGKIIYGVTGTASMGSQKSCSKDGEVDCEISSGWQAVDKTRLNKADIRNGKTIGSVTGIYPSAGAPLNSGTWVPDLTNNLHVQLREDKQYEYFNRYGERFVERGDSNLKPENLRIDLSILGLKGKFDGVDYDRLNVHDVKLGVKIRGDMVGKLEIAATCNSEALCKKVSWTDNTAKVNAATKACGASSGQCLFQDRQSRLEWYFELNSAIRSWHDAARACEALVKAGKSDWRLPTQKETMQATIHGLHQLGHYKHYTGRTKQQFWTSTGNTHDTKAPDRRMVFQPADGTFDAKHRGGGSKADYMCVRNVAFSE